MFTQEILEHILLYLPITDIVNFSRTCEQHHLILESQGFWRARAIEDLFIHPARFKTPDTDYGGFHQYLWHLHKHNIRISRIIGSAIGHALNMMYLHPVRLELVFRPDPFIQNDIDRIVNGLDMSELHKYEPRESRLEFDQFEITEDDNTGWYSVNMEERVLDGLLRYGWEYQPFSYVTEITGWSDKNGNDDGRGGSCHNLRIPVTDFRHTIKRDTAITMRDLTEITYRLKGSKYDLWYELYGGADFTYTKFPNEMLMYVDFGYGS